MKRPGLAADAFGDAGYMSAAFLNAVHALNKAVVFIGIPAWVVYSSSLPRWVVSAAMFCNAAVVIALQVPLSAYARDTRRALVAAGVLTAVGCASLAAGAALSAWALWALLMVTCPALALGEILGAAAGWSLSYDLAPDQLLGQYQAMWQLMADGSTKAAGPAVIGWALAEGPVGWAVLAAGFVVVAVISPAAVTFAKPRGRRHRTRCWHTQVATDGNRQARPVAAPDTVTCTVQPSRDA